jgi:hypothetical protein
MVGGDGTDIVELGGLMGDYTITSIGGGYRVTDAVNGRDGSDTLFEVETLRFSDGSTLSLPASAPAAPQVLPALAGGKTAAAEPEVLPATFGDKAVGDGPEILPGETEVFPTLVRDRLTAADLGSRDSDIADTLSMFGELTVDDAYLFAGIADAGSPEVLPAIADDFVLTAKFQGPPVLPPLDGDFEVVGLLKDIEFAQGLRFSAGSGESANPHVSADGLTVFDDWSAFAPPAKHDVWE